MPISEDRVKDIKALIPAAKKAPIQFGLCLGKSAEDTVLVLHKLKDGKALAKIAKEEAGGSVVTFGTVSVDGTVMTLDCEKKVPVGVAKSCQVMLRDNGIMLSVKFGKEGVE